jgi:CelD/BcsL family acetyltransferase involved in cellulose biosynthesis
LSADVEKDAQDQIEIGAHLYGAAPSVAATRSRAIASLELVASSALPAYAKALSELSESAVVRNVFYEPWMIFPAIRELADQENLHFVLVFGPDGRNAKRPLWGFFPLEVRPNCLHLPIRTLAFWQHRYCYLAAPLIEAAHVWEVLDAFWRWFEKNSFGCHILDTGYLPGEGALHYVWSDFAIGRSSMMLLDYARAALVPRESAESYLTHAVSKRHRDEFLRLERRLGELGVLEYRLLEDPLAVDVWVEDFLRLEQSGWKGQPGGGAILNFERDAEYFRTTTREGFRNRRILLNSVALDGKPIAMKHSLLCGDGGFTFKIAYDEAYSKYSPGLLLELDTIRRVCRDRRIRWLDSGAAPRHFMANRIWTERRLIRRTLFSDGSGLGDFWISILPLLRSIRKRFSPRSTPTHLQISTNSKGV